jgi:deoxyadenosine/deoxycytidine kinase
MFDEKPLKEEYVTYYFNELLPCKMDRILVYVKASCESINKRIEKRNDKTLIYHKQNSIERIIYVVDNIVDFWINRYGREKVYIVDNGKITFETDGCREAYIADAGTSFKCLIKGGYYDEQVWEYYDLRGRRIEK